MIKMIFQRLKSLCLILSCVCVACAVTPTVNKNIAKQQLSHSGVTLSLSHCKNVARDVHCLVIIRSDNPESLVDIGGKAQLLDDNGNQYPVNYTKIDDNALNIIPNRITRIKIIASQEIHYRLMFHNIANKAASLHTLDFSFEVQSPARSGPQIASFQDVYLPQE